MPDKDPKQPDWERFTAVSGDLLLADEPEAEAAPPGANGREPAGAGANGRA
jgi:hypothetical protein